MRYLPLQTCYVDNRDLWKLELQCFRHPPSFDPARRPLLMVPGYAMNSFILSYHPSSYSLVEYLCREGFEVWTSNLRGQGGAIELERGARGRFGLEHLSLVDLPCVLDWIRQHTATSRDPIDVIGCSLGASIVYGYLAHHRRDHGLGALISMGGPLRWETVHPAMRLAFSNPTLAGLLPIKGTRSLARAVLPVVQRFPALLSIYMNARIIDLSHGPQLVNTVDDPVPRINEQIAWWMRDVDLKLEGLNVSEQLRGMELPVFCILANADGIVPPATVLSVRDVLGAHQVSVLEVGEGERWFAHADLFISDYAQDWVFAPIRDWLLGPACAA